MRNLRLIGLLACLLLGVGLQAQIFTLLPSAEYFCEDPNCTVENLCNGKSQCEKAFKEKPPTCPCRSYEETNTIAADDEEDWTPQDPIGVLSGFGGGLCGFLGDMAPWCDMIIECLIDRDECAFNCFDFTKPGVSFEAGDWAFCKKLCTALPFSSLCPSLACAEQFQTTGQVGPSCCSLIDWMPVGDNLKEEMDNICTGAFACIDQYNNSPSPDWHKNVPNKDCCSVLDSLDLIPGISEDVAQSIAASCVSIGQCVAGFQDGLPTGNKIWKAGRSCCRAIRDGVNTADALASGWSMDPGNANKMYQTCKGFVKAYQCFDGIKDKMGKRKGNKSSGLRKSKSRNNSLDLGDYLPKSCCKAVDIAHATGADPKKIRAIKGLCRYGFDASECADRLLRNNAPKRNDGLCCDLIGEDLKYVDNVFGTSARKKKALRYGSAACQYVTGLQHCLKDGISLDVDFDGGVMNTLRRGVPSTLCCQEATNDDLISEVMADYADGVQRDNAGRILGKIQDACRWSYNPDTLLDSIDPTGGMLSNVANAVSAGDEINLETFVPTESFCAGVAGGADYIPDSTLSSDKKRAARALCKATESLHGSYLDYKKNPSEWSPSRQDCKHVKQAVTASGNASNAAKGARTRFDSDVLNMMHKTCTRGINEVECVKQFELASAGGSTIAANGETLTSAMAFIGSPQCEHALSALSKPSSTNEKMGGGGLQVLGQVFSAVQMMIGAPGGGGGSDFAQIQGAVSLFELVVSGLMSQEAGGGTPSPTGPFAGFENPVVESINEQLGLPDSLWDPSALAEVIDLDFDTLTGGNVDFDNLFGDSGGFGNALSNSFGLGDNTDLSNILGVFGNSPMGNMLAEAGANTSALGEAYSFLGSSNLESFLNKSTSSGSTVAELLQGNSGGYTSLTDHEKAPFGGVWGEVISAFMETDPATMQQALNSSAELNGRASTIKQYQADQDGQAELVVTPTGVGMQPGVDICPDLVNTDLPAGGVSVEGFLAAKQICDANVNLLSCYHEHDFTDGCCRVLEGDLSLPKMVNVGSAVPSNSLIYPFTNSGVSTVVDFTELYEYGQAQCSAGRSLEECTTNFLNFGGAWRPTNYCCMAMASASSNQVQALGVRTQTTFTDSQGYTRNTAYGALEQVCAAVNDAGSCAANPTVQCCAELYENDLDHQVNPALKRACKPLLQCHQADEVTPACCGFFRYDTVNNLDNYCSQQGCYPGQVKDPYSCAFCVNPADISNDQTIQQQFIADSQTYCD